MATKKTAKKAASRPAKKAARKKPAPAPGAERKDHVLQARVPESLYADLVDQARRLRVPVSNLVRNILEDSLRMVENIVDGGIEIAAALGGVVDDETLSEVVGWQPMTTNKPLRCAKCTRPIDKAEPAFTSIGAPGGRTIVLCEECQCRL